MYKPEKTTVERKRPPPIKVLSGQLRTADSGDGYVVTLGRGRSLLVSLVWMQGTVLDVQLHKNTVMLVDETGTFAVQGVNNIPKGKPCLSQGKWNTLKLVCDPWKKSYSEQKTVFLFLMVHTMWTTHPRAPRPTLSKMCSCSLLTWRFQCTAATNNHVTIN